MDESQLSSLSEYLSALSYDDLIEAYRVLAHLDERPVALDVLYDEMRSEIDVRQPTKGALIQRLHQLLMDLDPSYIIHGDTPEADALVEQAVQALERAVEVLFPTTKEA